MRNKILVTLVSIGVIATAYAAVIVTHPAGEVNNFSGPINLKTGSVLTVEAGATIANAGTATGFPATAATFGDATERAAVTPTGEGLLAIQGDNETIWYSVGSSIGDYSGIPKFLSAVTVAGATSGAVAITAPATAGTRTQTLQAATDTFVYRATADTLTNKTIDKASNTLTGVAGSGANADITSITSLTGSVTGSTALRVAFSSDTQLFRTGAGALGLANGGGASANASFDAAAYRVEGAGFIGNFGLAMRNSTMQLVAGSSSLIKWSNNTDGLAGSVDTGLGRNAAGVVEVNSGALGTLKHIKAETFVAGGTDTSCTGATIGTGSKNNAGFVTATTTGASSIVITFSFTAATGWAVMASNGTTVANLVVQTASTTTTATIAGTTVSGDVIRYIAFPY